MVPFAGRSRYLFDNNQCCEGLCCDLTRKLRALLEFRGGGVVPVAEGWYV